MNSPQSETNLADDLGDYLDYFEHHRHSKKSQARHHSPGATAPENVEKAGEIALSGPQEAASKPVNTPTSERADELGEGHDDIVTSLACGWKGIRRPPCDQATLLSFQELSDGPDAYSHQDDGGLLEAKIEREVARLKDSSRDEQEAYRKLLTRYPGNTSRAAITRLIDKGRTPRQIRLTAKIRRRCEVLAAEFNRVDLWGRKFSSSSNCTVSWELADRLRVANLHSRLELFKFFRHLVDQLSTSDLLRKQFHGAFNLANSVLPHRCLSRNLDDFSWPATLKDKLARAGMRETWKWQNPSTNVLSLRGLPMRNTMQYFITDLREAPTRFIDYRCAKNMPPINDDSPQTLSAYLGMRLIREGPISHSMMRSLYAAATQGLDAPPTFAQILGRLSDKAFWIGQDIWYYRDRPRFGRLPRKANVAEGPTVELATDYDLGLGFLELQRMHPSKTIQEIELELLKLWRSDSRELLTVQAAVRRYQDNYGRLDIQP